MDSGGDRGRGRHDLLTEVGQKQNDQQKGTGKEGTACQWQSTQLTQITLQENLYWHERVCEWHLEMQIAE